MLMSHNEKTVTLAKERLLKYGTVGVIQATGTGKSFVAQELLRAVDAHKVLVIIPKNIMEAGLSAYDWSAEMEYMSYSKLCNHLSKEQVIELAKEYDAVIFDEAHHIGAKTWKNNCAVLKKHSRYSIFLTATPIRTDTLENVVESWCDKKATVYGPSLEEAVAKGILPMFKYYAVADAETKHTLFMRGELSMADYLGNLVTVDEHIREYTAQAPGKWLIFCASIEQLNYTLHQVSAWFDDEAFVASVHAGKSSKENLRILDEFSTSDKKYSALLCVDMLNEGLHIDGVTGIIMLRKTSSPTIFEQQLGRGLAAGKNHTPVVIDVLSNYANMTYARDKVESIIKHVNKANKKDHTGVIYSVSEYAVKDATLIDAERIWGDRPDYKRAAYLLKKYYEVEGTRAFKRVQGLTRAQCRTIVRKEKLKFSNRWTAKELEILSAKFPTMGDDCESLLPKRTRAAVRSKAYSMHLRKELR